MWHLSHHLTCVKYFEIAIQLFSVKYTFFLFWVYNFCNNQELFFSFYFVGFLRNRKLGVYYITIVIFLFVLYFYGIQFSYKLFFVYYMYFKSTLRRSRCHPFCFSNYSGSCDAYWLGVRLWRCLQSLESSDGQINNFSLICLS